MTFEHGRKSVLSLMRRTVNINRQHAKPMSNDFQLDTNLVKFFSIRLVHIVHNQCILLHEFDFTKRRFN